MKEMRCIVFDTQEVFRAVVAFRQKHRRPLPSGEVRRVEVIDKAPVRIIYHLQNLLEETNELVVEATELTAAMLSYAIERNIPVPRKSHKFVTIVNTDIALTFDLFEHE